VVGVGAGVYDRLVELGLPVVAYNGGEAPYDKERFVNARAEDYWNLRELFENGEIDIDELDDVLAAQLGSLKWTLGSRGRIKIESKDDMRKRGTPSPTARTPLPKRSPVGVEHQLRLILRVTRVGASLGT
jgi:hypothetical protein